MSPSDNDSAAPASSSGAKRPSPDGVLGQNRKKRFGACGTGTTSFRPVVGEKNDEAREVLCSVGARASVSADPAQATSLGGIDLALLLSLGVSAQETRRPLPENLGTEDLGTVFGLTSVERRRCTRERPRSEESPTSCPPFVPAAGTGSSSRPCSSLLLVLGGAVLVLPRRRSRTMAPAQQLRGGGEDEERPSSSWGDAGRKGGVMVLLRRTSARPPVECEEYPPVECDRSRSQ